MGQEEAGVKLLPRTIRAELSPMNEEEIKINATEICSEQIANNGPHSGFATQ